MRNRLILIGLMLPVFLFYGCLTNSRKAENLHAFAKAYGYVKYFHPGDGASEINWAKFSAYGAKEIEKCRTPNQVGETLNRLFNPIAPSARFLLSENEPDYDLKIITPDDTSGCRLAYWQHQGVSIGMKTSQPYTYKSVRVNGKRKQDEKIFEVQPKAGTNGNINPFELPGGYTISWTGMKVLKHNGSQHHGIGILPDIYVEKTIKGVMEGRDEFLEKAIEIAKQK